MKWISIYWINPEFSCPDVARLSNNVLLTGGLSKIPGISEFILFNIYISLILLSYYYFHRCLESGSVGSARFWLPGSGSLKICESTDPEQRAKFQPKTEKKNFFTLKTQIWTFDKKRDSKNFLNSEWFIKF